MCDDVCVVHVCDDVCVVHVCDDVCVMMCVMMCVWCMCVIALCSLHTH